jgi:hypothetical protein
MIARISDAIRCAGGCVLDFRFFSNLALFIEAEAATARLHALLTALAATELKLDSRSIAKLRELSASCSQEMQDVRPIHLFVTFIHGDPDLRIPVPAIPG